MTRNKDIIFKTYLLITILLTLVGLLTYKAKKNATPGSTNYIKPLPSPANTKKIELSSLSKIEVSGIKMNNFYQQAVEIKEDGFAKFVSNKNYQIMYIPIDNSFLISIISSQFEETRREAEENLLKILGLDKENACRLNINVTTPAYANPDFAGKIYKPSFCENK